MTKKPKQQKRVCIKCFKEVDEKSNYYSFTEYDNLKIININYAHRFCWDEFLKSLSTLSKAQSMLSQMEKPLEAMGFLQPKEVIIK